jgi:hypothetical protein
MRTVSVEIGGAPRASSRARRGRRREDQGIRQVLPLRELRGEGLVVKRGKRVLKESSFDKALKKPRQDRCGCRGFLSVLSESCYFCLIFVIYSDREDISSKLYTKKKIYFTAACRRKKNHEKNQSARCDDSLFYRKILSQWLSGDSGFEVVAVATDAFDAREKISQYSPDVITLDLEMRE